MSLAKSGTMDGMKYEASGKKTISDPAAVDRKMYRKAIEKRSTVYTIYVVVMKHKMVFLVAGNVVLILNWVFPPWFQLVLSVFGK